MNTNPSPENQSAVTVPCRDNIEAQFACGLLVSNGIDASIYAEGIGPITGEIDGPMPVCGVVVARADLHRARSLLELHTANRPEDIEWEKYKVKGKRRGKILGRIIGLLTATAFALLAYWSQDRSVTYIVLGCSIGMMFVVLFSFDWSREGNGKPRGNA